MTRATREDIKVEEKYYPNSNKKYSLVSVTIGNKEYGASYSDDESRLVAIKMLAEQIMKKEIGIIEHDIMMKVIEFEMGEVDAVPNSDG